MLLLLVLLLKLLGDRFLVLAKGQSAVEARARRISDAICEQARDIRGYDKVK